MKYKIELNINQQTVKLSTKRIYLKRLQPQLRTLQRRGKATVGTANCQVYSGVTNENNSAVYGFRREPHTLARRCLQSYLIFPRTAYDKWRGTAHTTTSTVQRKYKTAVDQTKKKCAELCPGGISLYPRKACEVQVCCITISIKIVLKV